MAAAEIAIIIFVVLLVLFVAVNLLSALWPIIVVAVAVYLILKYFLRL